MDVVFDERAMTTNCPRHSTTVGFPYCGECRYHEGHKGFTVYCGCPEQNKPQSSARQLSRATKMKVKMMWLVGFSSIAGIAEKTGLRFDEVERILNIRR